MIDILKLMRPHHYIKNFLIFFPLFFSGRFCEISLLLSNIVIFSAFSLVCSAVYVINDYRDIERDRMHPVKCRRPLASGKVSKPQACILVVALFAGAILLLVLVHAGYKTLVCVGLYILINTIYSVGAKNIPILDIVLLSSGYPLRVMLGGYTVNIEVSEWLFLTILCISFFLALGKRCEELKEVEVCEENGQRADVRPVLKRYTVSYLENHMYLSMGLGIVFYSFWTIEKNSYFIWTVPFVLIICMLYNWKLKDAGGDPVEVLLSSKPLIALIFVYVIFSIVILYVI